MSTLPVAMFTLMLTRKNGWEIITTCTELLREWARRRMAVSVVRTQFSRACARDRQGDAGVGVGEGASRPHLGPKAGQQTATGSATATPRTPHPIPPSRRVPGT
jgi:hypothetical protein